MRNRRFIIGISSLIFIFLVGLISFKIVTKTKQSQVAEGKKGKRKILYYRAPMDPTYISDKPGKSPMGMDLIPVYEGEETAESGVIRIDPVTVQNIGVRSQIAKRIDLVREIRTIGRIDYDERRVAYVNTKIGGWVEKLYVDYTGQSVKKGDRLLEIYSPELVATQEEYILAFEYVRKLKENRFKEISERALDLLKSSRKRLEYWDITEDQIIQLEKTGQVNKTLIIHSPVTGVVIHKNVLEGKYIKPGENLYRIGDISKIWVYADIYEYEVPWVRIGQVAEMSLSYLPGKIFKGKVTYIYPYLETKTRTIKVRLEFENPNWELKPDMYADVRIQVEPKKNVLAIPKEAVIHSGLRTVIIVDKGHGFFEPRDVKIGLEATDYYEVLNGLNEGEKVVTSSQFLIDSESRLKEAIAKMLKAKRLKQEVKEAKLQKHRQISIRESTRKAMEEVWDIYFRIRKELSNDSLANIGEQVSLIQTKLMEILDSDESGELKDLFRDMIKAVGRLQPEEKDIVRVREGFLELSKYLIDYMRKFDRDESIKKGYKLFFCGMEKKRWVQLENKPGNPYLGSSMVRCGVQEDY